jgi:hypothetical protein
MEEKPDDICWYRRTHRASDSTTTDHNSGGSDSGVGVGEVEVDGEEGEEYGTAGEKRKSSTAFEAMSNTNGGDHVKRCEMHIGMKHLYHPHFPEMFYAVSSSVLLAFVSPLQIECYIFAMFSFLSGTLLINLSS